MKAIDIREMRHIAKNFSLRKRASGYRMDSYSMTISAIYDLIKRNMIRCTKASGSFMFFIPTKHFLETPIESL